MSSSTSSQEQGYSVCIGKLRHYKNGYETSKRLGAVAAAIPQDRTAEKVYTFRAKLGPPGLKDHPNGWPYVGSNGKKLHSTWLFIPPLRSSSSSSVIDEEDFSNNNSVLYLEVLNVAAQVLGDTLSINLANHSRKEGERISYVELPIGEPMDYRPQFTIEVCVAVGNKAAEGVLTPIEERKAALQGLQNQARVALALHVVDLKRDPRNPQVLAMQNSLRARQAREEVEKKQQRSQEAEKRRKGEEEAAQRPSTVAAPAGGKKKDSNETVSERARQRVEERERRDAGKIQNATDRIFKAQSESIIQYEEKLRVEIEAEEGEGFQRIKRSEKAHMEFVLVDAERIRREEAPPEPPHHDEGLDLLFNFLKKDRPEDEAQQIHEDRRRRVTSLIEAKKYSEKMSEDLAARKKYTDDIQAEAERIKEKQAEDLKQHLRKQAEKQQNRTVESVSHMREETEAGRQRRLEQVQENVNYTRQHGNSRRRIHEAEEKRERTKNLKKQSDWTRRGFLKSPLRSRTASPAGSPSRRPTTVAADPRRRSNGQDDEQSRDVYDSHDASPESERSLQPFEDENDQRPITVPRKEEQVSKQDSRLDQRKGGEQIENETAEEAERRQQKKQLHAAEEERFRAMSQKHMEKREQMEQRHEERRRKEKEAHEAAIAKSREIHERRQREREEEKARALNIEEEKNKLRTQISRDGQRRRELEEQETQLVNSNLKERINDVQSKEHPLRSEMRALEEDSKMVKDSHKKTVALSKTLEKEERKKNLESYLQRHTAEASRQAELVAMREQRKEDCSRIWQDKVKAQNERQEVARLQQLMNVKNSAMETKADSLMAREVVVRNKAMDALQKQQRVAEQRKKHFASQAGANRQRKILEQLYSHPPDMQHSRQTRSAMEHRDHSSSSKKENNTTPGFNSSKNNDSRSMKQQREDHQSPSATLQDSYALVSISTRRAHTPQPIKVLPDELRMTKPTLTKPTPALLRTLEAPEELKQKAWRLYSLLEEVREEEKQAFIANIKGSGKYGGGSAGQQSLNTTTTANNSTTRTSDTKPIAGEGGDDKTQSRLQEDDHHTSQQQQVVDPEEQHHEEGQEKKPWELPKRIKTVSDRLTSKSVAQDANNLLRQKQVMNTTIHDDLPKVHTPNRRLYEDPETRANRQAMEQDRKEKQKWDEQLGKGKIRDFDGDFAQRFYNDQVTKHQRVLEADRSRALRQSGTNKRKDITLDDEDLMHLVGRLHKKSETKTVKATSAQMNSSEKKDDPVRPSPARQRLDQQIIEKLYVEAGEKQKKEISRLDKKYYTSLQDKQNSRTKKLTEEQMEESRERLFRGEIYQE